MNNGFLKYIFAVALATVFLACSRPVAEKDVETGNILTHRAQLLTMVELPDSSIAVTIKNPWDTASVLGRYLLVDRNLPDDKIPEREGWKTIKVPVQSALIYSSVHTSPLEELGSAGMITGIADAAYFSSNYIRQNIEKGTITDVGNSMSPSLEKIVELSPEIAIVSPYENSGHGILDKTGTTVIDMADYMESTPLGRAEWIKLLGALSGKREMAEKIYLGIVEKYDSISNAALKINSEPLVLCELPISGVWYQPGGESYMSRLITDAGGRTLLKEDKNPGSVQLDIANVYDKGVNSEIWLIKATKELTGRDITDATALASEIKAMKTGNVWYVNTTSSNFYDELAFHPEKILEDFASVFHPEIFKNEKRYFKKIKL